MLPAAIKAGPAVRKLRRETTLRVALRPPPYLSLPSRASVSANDVTTLKNCDKLLTVMEEKDIQLEIMCCND